MNEIYREMNSEYNEEQALKNEKINDTPPSITQRLNYESYTEEIELSFQKTGGPYRLEGTFYETENETYDFTKLDIYKNGDFFRNYQFSTLNDKLNEIYEDIAKDLLRNYPDYIDKEAYYANSTDFNKHIPIQDFLEKCNTNYNQLKEEVSQLNRDNKYSYIVSRRCDYEEIEQNLKTALFPKEHSDLINLEYLYHNKLQAYNQSQAAYDSRSVPSFFSFRERYAYYQEGKALKQDKAELKNLKTALDDQRSLIAQKEKENDVLIHNTTVELRKIKTGLKDLTNLSRLCSEVSKLQNKQEAIAITGNINNVENVLTQKNSILKQTQKLLSRQNQQLSKQRELAKSPKDNAKTRGMSM